jgi:2-polyprenyl-3-methyl-5-hydroxy-6-metoxy-1,4-benzoquinol methylase
VNEEKILVIGDGYNGYDFHIWPKPTEKWEIYIKAFELTQNIQLSEWKLSNPTKNKISELSENYKLYEGNKVIDEGTFEHYYPTRFEL